MATIKQLAGVFMINVQEFCRKLLKTSEKEFGLKLWAYFIPPAHCKFDPWTFFTGFKYVNDDAFLLG